MAKKVTKQNFIEWNGKQYRAYEEPNGDRYCYIPFPEIGYEEIEDEIIEKLRKEQPELFKDEDWFYNEFLPHYQAKMTEHTVTDEEREKLLSTPESV